MYDKNNVFAKIIRKEIPCTPIYEDEFVLAFKDLAPVTPVHVLVIPKGEYVSFSDFTARASAEVVSYFFKAVNRVATQLVGEIGGYRILSNIGEEGGQTVLHFHVHILAGEKLGGIYTRESK